MSIIVTQKLKETIPFFELFTEGEEVKLDSSVIHTISTIDEPRPDDVDKLQTYIVNRAYLGFDVIEDAKWLMWVGSVDPMQLFTPDLRVRSDLHPVVIRALNLVKRDELVSCMGPWRCEDAASIGNLYLLSFLHIEIVKYLRENGVRGMKKLVPLQQKKDILK